MKISCWFCKREHALAELLDTATWWQALNVLQVACPSLTKTFELRVETGRISEGYVYAAGAPHFADMIHHAVPGLEVSASGDVLDVTLGDRHWSIRASS